MRNILVARQNGRWEQVISEADQITTMCYSCDHTSTPVYWYRGVSNYVLKKTGEALSDFQKAYAIHPFHIHVLNNLGSCYETLGDHGQAELWYLKALTISPTFSETLINLSAVYYNMEEYLRAYETIMRVGEKCDDSRRKQYLKAIRAKLSQGSTNENNSNE